MLSQLPGGRIPTTAAEWIAIQEKVELHARSPYSPRDKRVLWGQGIIVLLSGVLYLISLLRRASMNGLWCIHKDLDGYWHPNVHVAIPIVTIAHAATQTAGIGLIVIADAPEGKIPCIVALNLAACSLLYFAGWTKVWAVLYALPSSIFRLRRRNVLGSTAMITKRRILSPRLFNNFILSGYLIGLLPIPWLSYTVYWVQGILLRLTDFRMSIKNLITVLSTSPNPEDLGTSLLLTVKVGQNVQGLQKAQNEALKSLRIFSGAWLIISFSALVVFLAGSLALLLALTRQIEILGKIQKQRETLMAGRGSIYDVKTVHPPTDKGSQAQRVPRPNRSLLGRIQLWMPSLRDDDEEDPLGPPPPTTPPQYHVTDNDGLGGVVWPHRDGLETGTRTKGRLSMSNLCDDARRIDETSRKNRRRLVKYCVGFAWQAVFCTLIATSYIVLNIFVVFNVLDAPRSISLSQLLRTIEQWAAWSWGGGPGAILGLLACVVAFARNPSLPREPEKGPPIAADANIHDPDGDDDDEEDLYGMRTGDQHSLTVEKLHLHGASDGNSSEGSPKVPQAVLTSLSGSSNWKGLRSKLGFSPSSQPTMSSRSRNPPPSSEASTGISRNWSPFQIITTANIISMQHAQPYPLIELPKSNPQTQQSHHQENLNCSDGQAHNPKAYHYPTASSQNRPTQQYPLPVQISRSELCDNPNYPVSPRNQKQTSPTSPTEGHFDAIHQLRGR